MSAPGQPARYDATWLTSKTMAMLALAVDFDSHRRQLVALVQEVAARYGDRGTFTVACSLAACVAHLDGYQLGTDGFYGFLVQDAATGQIVAPEQIPGGEDVMAGMRFVTAYANDDEQGMLDLFHAQPGEVFTGLCMLAGAAVRDGGGLTAPA